MPAILVQSLTRFSQIQTYILYWGLRQTSDRKATPTNDGHLEYTDTLRSKIFGIII